MFNPLAIGMSLGGLLLDRIAPRPKPLPGHPLAEARTLRSDRTDEQHVARQIAGG